MNKDQVKGAANDVAGQAKRQVGEWTNNPNTQAEGAAQQAKGKVQKAWGAIKDAAQKTNANVHREHDSAQERKTDLNRESEREHAHSAHK